MIAHNCKLSVHDANTAPLKWRTMINSSMHCPKKKSLSDYFLFCSEEKTQNKQLKTVIDLKPHLLPTVMARNPFGSGIPLPNKNISKQKLFKYFLDLKYYKRKWYYLQIMHKNSSQIIHKHIIICSDISSTQNYQNPFGVVLSSSVILDFVKITQTMVCW